MTDESPTYELRPTEARWTHIALRVDDMDASIEWYTSMTPLVLIERREDEAGYGAWLGMPGATNNPFILVLAHFFPQTDPFRELGKAVLAPFSHLGIELPTREAVDEVAARGERMGCLAVPAQRLPPPIGYVCMLHDPDGNLVEFSWDQGVYATLTEKWGATG